MQDEQEKVNDPTMNILIWSPTGVGTHYSGPATSTYRLFSALKQQFPSVKFSLAHGSDEQESSSHLFESQFKIVGVHQIGVNKSHFINKLRYLWKSYRWIKINAVNYDLIYMPVSNIYTLVPLLWFQRLEKPVVTRLASNHELYNSSRLRKAIRLAEIRAWFLKKSQIVVAISSDISKRLRKLGVPTDMILDLPNLVDTERYTPRGIEARKSAKYSLGLDANRFVVSVVGSICPRKNQISLIKALCSLPDNIQLILAGPFINDEYELRIKGLVNELNLVDRVTFTGHLDDVAGVYNASDLYCLPSTAEGMPNSLLEAMSSGLPSIASKIEGNSDLIGDGASRGLYTDGTAESLSSEINKLYSDSDLMLRLSESARSFIEEKHSYNNNVPKLYGKFTSLVGE